MQYSHNPCTLKFSRHGVPQPSTPSSRVCLVHSWVSLPSISEARLSTCLRRLPSIRRLVSSWILFIRRVKAPWLLSIRHLNSPWLLFTRHLKSLWLLSIRRLKSPCLT